MDTVRQYERAENCVGKSYNRLTVISLAGFKKGIRRAVAKCECGNIREYDLPGIKNGNSKSCGCLHIEQAGNLQRDHTLSRHPIYKVWLSMKQRCHLASCYAYKYYGARGISVCDKWRNEFIPFYDWCINNGWVKGLQIDRIDNNGNYTEDNCRFVTPHENCLNKRNTVRGVIDGIEKPIYIWAKEKGISYKLMRSRLKRGLSIQDLVK